MIELKKKTHWTKQYIIRNERMVCAFFSFRLVVGDFSCILKDYFTGIGVICPSISELNQTNMGK